ncbi:MAG: hypothetical protein ACQERS_08235 [Bacteroidota bacterium]
MKRTMTVVTPDKKNNEQLSHMIRRNPRKLSPASPIIKRANIRWRLSFGESAMMARDVARLTADEIAHGIKNKFI